MENNLEKIPPVNNVPVAKPSVNKKVLFLAACLILVISLGVFITLKNRNTPQFTPSPSSPSSPNTLLLSTPTPTPNLSDILDKAMIAVESIPDQTVEISLNDQKFYLTIPQEFKVDVSQNRTNDPLNNCISIRSQEKTTRCDTAQITFQSLTYTLWWMNRLELLGGGGYIPTHNIEKKILFNTQPALLTSVFEGKKEDNLGLYFQLIETTSGEPFGFYAYHSWDLFSQTKNIDNTKYHEIFLKLASRVRISKADLGLYSQNPEIFLKPAPDAVNWKKYTSQKLGYSFKYPQSFHTFSNGHLSQEEECIMCVPPPGFNPEGDTVDNPNNLSLLDLVIIEGIGEVNVDLEKYRIEPINIDNKISAVLSTNFTPGVGGEETFVYFQPIISRSPIIYLIFQIDDLKLIKNIISTLEFD